MAISTTRPVTRAEGATATSRVIVGSAARAAAASDPQNTIASAKRLIGRGVDDVKSLGEELPYEFVTAESAVPRLRTLAGDVTAVEVSAEILKGRVATPADITGTTTFLASKDSDYMTGQMISIDGGWVTK